MIDVAGKGSRHGSICQGSARGEPVDRTGVHMLDGRLIDERIFRVVRERTWMPLSGGSHINRGARHDAVLLQQSGRPVRAVRQRPHHPLSPGVPAGDTVVAAVHLRDIGDDQPHRLLPSHTSLFLIDGRYLGSSLGAMPRRASSGVLQR